MLKYVICMILIVILIIVLIYPRSNIYSLVGGSREAIFSRFDYVPEFPMISQLDSVDLDRFSKVYNTAGPLKFISGRPYRYYKSEDSTWLYPWNFPHEMDRQCTTYASRRCNESPIILVKKEEGKLNGLAVQTPKDIVRTSPCFNKNYDRCRTQSTILMSM